MLIVQVHVQVKANLLEDFIKATKENAENSIQEKGIARFDILQDFENPSKIILNEVYYDESAPVKHKQTTHYKKWRETVGEMMDSPRHSIKYLNIFPDDKGNWG